MDKDNLVLTIIKALEECKRSKATREAKNTFSANPWFDEECKMAKRNGKKNMNRESRNEYDQLIKKKKEEYANRIRIKLINLGKSSPRKFWKELQQRKTQIENNIIGIKWLEYAKTLYEGDLGEHRTMVTETTSELFSQKDIIQGIRRLAIGKVQDINGLQVKYLKWGAETMAPHITNIFNNVNREGFPINWTTSVVIPLHKSRDINNPSNCRTIMINPLFGKLFGSMVEQKISKWAETEGKRAKGQAGFRPKHFTIDHDITLRYLIEKVWDTQGSEAFCCFVDFKKAFDTVPRNKLWDRMEELEVPKELRSVVHRLYE